MTLSGRCGVVVGVSHERSLGFACVERLCADGAQVIATHRPSPGREGLPDRLVALGCVRTLALDVRSDADRAALAQAVEQQLGRADFLVHTVMHLPAGLHERPLTGVGRELFDQVVGDGVHSLVALCGVLKALLGRSGSASVVTLSSESGRLATPSYHVAGITKAALEAAVRSLALELGPIGVTCNAVSAPAIATQGAEAALGAEVIARTAAYVAKHNMTRRAVGPGDVADAVAFLVSTRARQLTGQVLTVDGGYALTYF